MSHDLGCFYDNLATMLSAGVQINRAVVTAASGSRRLRAAAGDMTARIAGGDSLAEAMAHHRHLFPPSDVQLLAVAESTGRLAEICTSLAGGYALKRRLFRIVLAGILYPLGVIHIAALVIPLPDLILGKIGFGGFVLSAIGTLMVFYVPAGAIWLVYRTPQHPWHAVTDRLMMRIPVVGGAMRDLAISRFCRSYHAMMEAGVKADACCDAASRLCGNRQMQARLIGGARTAAQGQPVYTGFSRFVPTDFRVAWENGEESGRLAETVQRMADDYTDRAESSFALVATWIPRMLYAVIGAYLVVRILLLAASLRNLYNV